MKIENLTNKKRNNNPLDGDLLLYTHQNGSTEKKYYYAAVVIPKEDTERSWRDEEIILTDFIVTLTDHPLHTEYLTYRQELRDYPAQEDFPNGERPLKP